MYEDLKASNTDLLSVAVDLQGPDKARPYHEQARAEFVTVVDQANSLSQLFGFRAIPNGILIDENGLLRYQKYGGFDIRKPEFLEVVQQFAGTGNAPEAAESGGVSPAHEHFERGYALYKSGDVEGAKAAWREGIAVDPGNWNMRKQLWAIENPDRFYEGDVDYGWQKQQIDAGR